MIPFLVPEVLYHYPSEVTTPRILPFQILLKSTVPVKVQKTSYIYQLSIECDKEKQYTLYKTFSEICDVHNKVPYISRFPPLPPTRQHPPPPPFSLKQLPAQSCEKLPKNEELRDLPN